MKSIQSISLLDILPFNLATDSTVKNASLAIDARLQATAGLIVQLNFLENLSSIPEQFLDELAYQYHVDFYSAGLVREQKELLVAQSLILHLRKGTPAAVEDLMTSLFGDGTVEEWFEYSGQPFHYRVYTTNGAVTTTQAQDFARALASVTRLSARLDSVQIISTESMPLYYGGFLHTGDNYKIG